MGMEKVTPDVKQTSGATIKVEGPLSNAQKVPINSGAPSPGGQSADEGGWDWVGKGQQQQQQAARPGAGQIDQHGLPLPLQLDARALDWSA